jgi:hypothetical protein
MRIPRPQIAECVLGGAAEGREVVGHAHNPDQPAMTVNDRHAPRITRQRRFVGGASRGVWRDRGAAPRDLRRTAASVKVAGQIGWGERTP